MDKIRDCCDETKCKECYNPNHDNCCTKCYTEIAHESTNEVVCPYCGYEYEDSWEFEKEWGELDCDECGKIFEYERFTETTYSTEKKERVS